MTVRYDDEEVINLPLKYVRAYVLACELEPYLAAFEKQVWHAGLRKKLADSRNRYFAGELCAGVAVRTGCLAGRVLITFEESDSQLTLIGYEDSETAGVGIQSSQGSVFDQRRLLELAVVFWPWRIEPSEEVSIA